MSATETARQRTTDPVTGRKLGKVPAPSGNGKPTPTPDLPEIDAGNQHLPSVTRQAWEALKQANKPRRMFRHGGRIIRTETGDLGELVLQDVNRDRMRFEATNCARWYQREQRKEESVLVDATPSDTIIRNILATPNPRLPILTRVVAAPVFASDGTLQTEPGYHTASRTFYAPADDFEVKPVPAEPSQEDVEYSTDLLTNDLLVDFPFTSKSEIAHAVALSLLPFARDLIPSPTPLHLIEKPSPGTGGTLLGDTLAYLAVGRPLTAMTEGRDEDEWRKRITATLRGGAAFVSIDNLRRRLDSAALSAAITSTTWEDRILGVSETIRLSVQCGWIATGNNPVLSSEIARRTIRIRLDARVDRPWLREGFKHPDLRVWAQQNRAELVWAALVLIRAWIVAGRPMGSIRLGMFEPWSEVMGGILTVAGIDGFLGNLDEFYAASDQEGAETRAFIEGWWDRHGSLEVTAGDLWDLAKESDLFLGNGTERSQRIKLGRLIVGMRDRVFGSDNTAEDAEAPG